MRKSDREIAEPSAIIDLIDRCQVCQVAFQTGAAPYIVSMSFGYANDEKDGIRLFFHCALEGRKLDLLRADPVVGFAMNIVHNLKTASKPCRYSQEYESVVGEGIIRIITNENERVRALSKLMEHYGVVGLSQANDYDSKVLALTCTLELSVTAISGKRLLSD